MSLEKEVFDPVIQGKHNEFSELDGQSRIVLEKLQNNTEKRFEAVERRMHEVEKSGEMRVQELSDRLDDLAVLLQSQQKATMVQFGEAITALGRHLTEIGKELEQCGALKSDFRQIFDQDE